ncbi:MAG: hypothetical protein HY314_14735 [Acidobacteria bacterium]|nr:hypothetical protein [Acidobacteriota bacterium]
MRSANGLNKLIPGSLVFLALIVSHLGELRAKLSEIEIARSFQTFSITHANPCDHRKSESQSKGAKKPVQILPGHYPEKLVESNQSIFGLVNFCLDLNQSAFERLDAEENLALGFLVLYLAPTKRAPPHSL